jgi:two-component system nitrogen regulation sensor histidine kinase NtrY
MANQLESERQELLETNLEIEVRRRFTEAVLSGVSAGVIGLDSLGRVELPNRSALDLLSTRADRLIGRPLIKIMPEVGEMIEQVKRRPDRRAETQITIERGGRTRTLLVRVGAERLGHELEGFVVTFDDISALVAAQRTAAWADVARRIAHEIKNPLTPIQLSAERIKRKYQHEIKSDPEVFITCTDTIIRQVGDIGRMIDEFSAFARMPAPVFQTEAVVDLVQQAVDLQEVEHPEISYIKEIPDQDVMLYCDGRQIVQVMTNVLRNAADAIAGRAPSAGEELDDGWIRIAIGQTDAEQVVIEVEDNGRGFPDDARERLVEPYVTTRTKGTGLGLAIVKKIMEDHDGELVLEDGADGGAKVRIIFRAAEGETSANGVDRTVPKVVSHGA